MSAPAINDRPTFIAPMPRLTHDGPTWVADLRRLESMGFDTVCVSEHLTNGWQLSALAAMAYAAASTTRLRILSLVLQNDLHHPALLAKHIATIDVLSQGRVELGIGAGWLPDDYHVLGLPFHRAGTRVARLAEAIQVIRSYFTGPVTNFDGDYYQVREMEALPRCVQQPNPPILVGAGGPAMLELAGRSADIVGVHAAMGNSNIGSAVADLSADSIRAKIARVRDAAASADRTQPRLQFTCYHVDVTDAPRRRTPCSSWAKDVDAAGDSLQGSPAVLIGTAQECADNLLEWTEQFGITYWNLGQDAEAASLIIEKIRACQP
ncbi:TIGR03621 family F420-dependent LLM class oxidoreductase [Mycolicibacterium vaccae]|uniref:TIGR03621 family F420-dependent LLM class oxidoreductase n=1 Tax=Mycolicibacterium vaccae TaxID=1810 RepID=UPI003D074B84